MIENLNSVVYDVTYHMHAIQATDVKTSLSHISGPFCLVQTLTDTQSIQLGLNVLRYFKSSMGFNWVALIFTEAQLNPNLIPRASYKA